MQYTSINRNTGQNIILTLLLISGTVKPFINIFLFKLDFTLFVAILVLIDMVLSVKTKLNLDLNKMLIIGSLVGFYFFMIVTLIYSSSNSYGYAKTINFSMNILYFIYPFFIKKINLIIILKVILLIILPLSIWFIIYRYFYWNPSFESVRLSKTGFSNATHLYLGLGTLLSVGTLIVYFKEYNFKLFVLLLAVLIGLGARGALLFTLLIILFTKFFPFFTNIINRFKLKIKKKTFWGSLIILLGSVSLYFYRIQDSTFFKYGLIRFFSLFKVKSDNSSLERVDRLLFAINHLFDSFFTAIFGHGIGSFGILYLGKDIREYPHNIYVETWFELGLIGLVLILFFTITPYFLKRDNFFKILAFFFLLNTFKSGSLQDLWLFFGFYGILVFSPKIFISKIKPKIE